MPKIETYDDLVHATINHLKRVGEMPQHLTIAKIGAKPIAPGRLEITIEMSEGPPVVIETEAPTLH